MNDWPKAGDTVFVVDERGGAFVAEATLVSWDRNGMVVQPQWIQWDGRVDSGVLPHIHIHTAPFSTLHKAAGYASRRWRNEPSGFWVRYYNRLAAADTESDDDNLIPTE